jgi:hypothetical protein
MRGTESSQPGEDEAEVVAGGGAWDKLVSAQAVRGKAWGANSPRFSDQLENLRREPSLSFEPPQSSQSLAVRRRRQVQHFFARNTA